MFDSSTDLDCAYIVTNSFGDWARLSTQAVIDGIGGKGNVVIARGVQGSPPEIEMYAVQKEMLDANPDIKVVAEIYTFCDDAKAQEALLGTIASLPEVDGVVGCGEGLGAVQAFQTAGRDLPVVAFAPSGRALKFWGEGNGAPGSVAVMSDPGQGVAALFTAHQHPPGPEGPADHDLPAGGGERRRTRQVDCRGRRRRDRVLAVDEGSRRRSAQGEYRRDGEGSCTPAGPCSQIATGLSDGQRLRSAGRLTLHTGRCYSWAR